MKVACISASQVPSPTANSMQVMKACQAIRLLGHEVCIFLPGTGKLVEKVDLTSYYGLNAPIEIEWMPSRRSMHRYDFALQAIRRARSMDAEVCYVWPIQAGIFSLLAGLPVIIELHGPPEGRFGPLLFQLFLRLPGKKRLLPITGALTGQIEQRFNIKQSMMRVSPNGVDLERYSNLPYPAVARELLGLQPLTTAVYSGHFYPGRGMSLLEELAKRFPLVSFMWVGGKPDDVNAWRERLTSENIGNITLTGFVENSRLPLYQAAADILLMPYEKMITGSSGDWTSYASPMKMFEYMACRRPIISSDLPVIHEMLNASNAILCPPEDVEAWSQALNSLIDDPEEGYSLAQQAWKDVQGYTWLERARKAFEGFNV